MNKINIACENLCFRKIINVLSTKLNNSKQIRVNGRHSDAFVFITCGSCSYTFDDGHTICVNEGDILYLAHHAVYKMDILTPVYQSIYCDFEFVESTHRKSDVYYPENISNAENLFLKLHSLYKTASTASFQRCMSVIYDIYAVIASSVCANYIAPTSQMKIKEVQLYIDSNCSDTQLSVSSLAHRVNMSEVYFRKLFKSQYGISPIQYIKSVRIKKAKELLEYPFMSTEECARQSGFLSLEYFCREFKKATGITPAEYRKKNY